MKRLIKRIAAWFVFIFTCRGSIAAEAERAGICDFSGQGKEHMRSMCIGDADTNNPSIAFGDSFLCAKEPTKGGKL